MNIAKSLLLLAILLPALGFPAHPEENNAISNFISNEFSSSAIEKEIWLNSELKRDIKNIMQHDYHQFRIKYWKHQTRTAWVLEEIGKERLITSGFIIHNKQIEKTKVLQYRESRGSEIQRDFFTQQFIGLTINQKNKLDKPIDGISGATLSVRAMKKMAALALYLHDHVNQTPQHL
ncbi:MAG: FMN-binding protein [Gammaproteobacteria bacterium]|nr:FMN-binding protein [Gammaproteobacteria bacterium]